MLSPRARVVVACFYPAFCPPASGGEQRLYYLYRHLSRWFDVTLVTTTYQDAPAELVSHGPGFNERRIPKHPDSNSVIHRLVQAGIGSECSAYVTALLGDPDSDYGRALSAEIAKADIVIHECPFTLSYDHGAGLDGKPRVYSSQNVEGVLARQMLHGAEGRRAAEFISNLEARLVGVSDLILATCEEERQIYIEHFGIVGSKVILVPNGFESDGLRDHSPSERNGPVLFMGSKHPPNIEALDFIVDVLAPRLANQRFDIVGAVCDTPKARTLPANVRLLGFVDPIEKQRLLSSCVAAINPLRSGAGTNLKMLDYLGAGAPVVTTSVGARGLQLTGEQAVLCELDELPSALAQLLDDPARRNRLGRAGALHAGAAYTWEIIAKSLASTLSKMAPRFAGRHLIWLCDYSVREAQGGGQVRLRHVLQHLGAEWQIDFICLSDDPQSSSEQLFPGVTEHRIPKTSDHRQAEVNASKDEWISIADVIAARYCSTNEALIERLLSVVGAAHAVVFEQCYLAPLLGRLPADLPVVYSSQNIETDLKESLLVARRDGASVTKEVRRLELELLHRAALVVCVSESDRQGFRRITATPRYVVVENGVDVRSSFPQRVPHGLPGCLAVFLGSAHPPNVGAARFIAERIAPLTSAINYVLAGSVCDALADIELPRNVHLVGFLQDDEMKTLLELADMAVNPLFDGGGSSLKVPEFFARGLPVITTGVGVRGYGVQDGRECLVRDTASEMVEAIALVAARKDIATRLGHAAWTFARDQLDWQQLGRRFGEALRRLGPPSDRPRLLAVTYRFSTPARGGAETFFNHVMKGIADNRRWDVTVAASRVGPITNNLGFSAEYGEPGNADGLPDFGSQVLLFPVDPHPAERMEHCRRLSGVWHSDSRLLARRFFDAMPTPALAGGWNHPEPTPSGLRRWSSRQSQLKLPAGTGVVEVLGWIPSAATISLVGPEGPVHRAVEGDFRARWDLELEQDTLIEVVVQVGLECTDDARELGFFASEISYESIGKHSARIDLGYDIAQLAHRVPLKDWVDALVEIADRPGDGDRQLFGAVRGPKSSELLQWLEAEVSRFDVVLVQGVPFSTSIDVVEKCRQAAVPVVVLPHFHMEDRFYHWPEFYRCFRNADAVIAAPTLSVPIFFDRIGARAVALPGGGVDPTEFDEAKRRESIEAFRKLHGSDSPFILHLGRKSGAKRYHEVLAAHQALIAQGFDVDLVLMGPDEDGVQLMAPRVFFYASAPRPAALGALWSASCLATMSESESFGIVIVEAWLAGTPVVANRNCAAFAELVSHGRDGMLVDDRCDLLHALTRYLNDEQLRLGHAINGRVKALGYTWSALSGRVSDVLFRTAFAGCDERRDAAMSAAVNFA